MSELLAAAKAVLSAWDDQYRSIDMRLKYLRAAVERAEKQEPARLSDEEIREVMLTNGFVVKDGHSDLKPYVFQAVRAIEQAVLGKNQ